MCREVKNRVLRQVGLEQVVARSIEVDGDQRLPVAYNVAKICELASRKEKRLNTGRLESLTTEIYVTNCLSPTIVIDALQRCNVNIAISLYGVVRLKDRRAECGEHSSSARAPSFL